VFPSGSAGLVSTVDEFLTFARLLRNGGEHEGKRLLSAESVAAMTTNQLTDEQVATAGVILGGRGWGLAQSVVVAPDDVSATPGRYGWEGGYGTTWFNDPHRDVTAIAFTQVSDFLLSVSQPQIPRRMGIDSGTVGAQLEASKDDQLSLTRTTAVIDIDHDVITAGRGKITKVEVSGTSAV
jgi:CubicO group peptidase (beta-lactamase class C family)